MNPFARVNPAKPAPALPKAKRVAKPRPLPKPIDDIATIPPGQRVILPYPPVGLSPNSRGHWSKKSRPAKVYRRECWVLALAAKLTAPKDGPIRLHLDFFPPDRQARDDDNAIASFKAGRDGIADALKADDSRFVTSHRWHTEPRSCVVVTIMEGP
jgi:Holliday junction resolvase RusA-like endonuclease